MSSVGRNDSSEQCPCPWGVGLIEHRRSFRKSEPPPDTGSLKIGVVGGGPRLPRPSPDLTSNDTCPDLITRMRQYCLMVSDPMNVLSL